MRLLLMLLLSFLISGCGDGSALDAEDEQLDRGISPIVLTYIGPKKITSDNANQFTMSGQCSSDEVINVTGNIKTSAQCANKQWNKVLDLSYLPNGKHQIKIESKQETLDLFIIKDTTQSNLIAHYEFDDELDIGKDSMAKNNAQSFASLDIIDDQQKNKVVYFDGANSQFELSDGIFLNSEFTERSITFFMKTSDLKTKQVLFDEGGSTNGFALLLKDDMLNFTCKSGAKIESLEINLSGNENQWIEIFAIFNNGKMTLIANEERQDAQAIFTSIPAHSNIGGFGKVYSSDVWGNNQAHNFQGHIDDLKIFDIGLSDTELALIKGEEPPTLNIDPFKIARISFFDFSDPTELGKDLDKKAPSVTSNLEQGEEDDNRFFVTFNDASNFQLSNGTFFNEEFTTKTYAFYFRAANLTTEQVLLEEGGTVNGISVYIENGSLTASIRAGGSTTQEDLTSDITGKENTWIKIILSFNKGFFTLNVNESETVKTLPFQKIPNHSDTGGVAKRYNDDASGKSGAKNFIGDMKKLSLYKRVLTKNEKIEY